MEFGQFRTVLMLGLMGLTAGGAGAAASEDGASGCLEHRLERAALLAATGTAAEEAKAFDEASGENLRNYPPDRVVDFLHMKLQMRFEKLEDRAFSATETLTFKPIGTGTSALKLDQQNLKITSVMIDSKQAEYSSDDESLSVRFDPPLAVGEEHTLSIEYTCEQPVDGMFFTPSSPDLPGYTREVHTQGEAQTNRHWFISHDAPNERLTTELIVDVPAEYQVSSNGKLVSNLATGDRAVWHYVQDKPHVTYLVSLVIGQFDIVEIKHARVPMKVWVAKGRGGDVERTYGRTGAMIDMFEKRFGVPYPWDRYDQLTVKNFGAGGMENTSVTSMYPTAIFDETALLDGDLDGLISHELCHQWSGDLITCKDFTHLWLNEGWATYGSAMWNEERYGMDGYLDSIRGNFGVVGRDKVTNERGMVCNVYESPEEVFRWAANPYGKGASVIHMLRMMLGEEVFWAGVQNYFKKNQHTSAETSEFRYAMEEVSGLGLEWFFDQWCYRPGAPELEVKVQYDGGTRELLVDVEQKQQVDARSPAYRFTLPVMVRTGSGEATCKVEVREKTTSYRRVLDGPPSWVAVDPYLAVLKTISVELPERMWEELAIRGPTIAAKHEAIGKLGTMESPDHVALLNELARDTKLRYTVRNSAVNALAQYAGKSAKEHLVALYKDGIEDARVRETVVRTFRGLEKDQAAGLLAEIADTDTSYGVRSAAIDGLAHHKAKESADLLVKLTEFRSQSEQVCGAALEALAELEEAKGIEPAMKYAALGNQDRLRPRAIEALGKLAKHEEEKVVGYLLPMLEDTEYRAVNAAGAALASIGHERAEEPIEAISKSAKDPELRKRAEGWLKTLREKLKEKEGGEGAASQPESQPDRPRRRERGG